MAKTPNKSKTTSTRKVPARKSVAQKAPTKRVSPPVSEPAAIVTSAPEEAVEDLKPTAVEVMVEPVQKTPVENIAPSKVADPAFEPFSFGVIQGYSDVFTRMQKQAEGLMGTAGQDPTRLYESLKIGGLEPFEALIKASTASLKGVHNVSTLLGEMAKAAVEENWDYSQKIASITSPQEMLDLQNDAVKAGYERMMNDTSRLAEVSSKITEDIMKPLQECYIHSMDK